LTVLNLPTVVTQAQALAVASGLKLQVTSSVSGVVLDASGLTQFDSSALAVMLSCRRAALAAGKSFTVQNLPAKLAQLAGLYGVAELLPQAV
jgi:phospholipid transport system transporter-binding protein